MKKSLTYLPDNIRENLAWIVKELRARTPAEMIILFGSYARGDYVVRDIRTEDGCTTVFESDYDVLIIIPDGYKTSPRDMESDLGSHFAQISSISVSPIVHSYSEAKERFERGNYFFYDIQREGRVLYDSGRFKLPKKRTKISKQERYERAKEYFDEYMDDIERFHKHYLMDLELQTNSRNNIAAFMLHQVAEKTYNMLNLVFTDYKPKTHNLKTMRRRTGAYKKGLREIFPLRPTAEKELFELFCTFYILSRYKLHFSVDRATLDTLAERVERLRRLAEEACLEKINSYLES